ncbi:tetratricopeptide repeat protein [Bosea sp. TWI1241]|uniref:tetratricopeptide repeat protein n=1 Tax=Bosea sp. TWI1241 TaxID=3148904 RepID=UPI003207BCCB
MRFKSDGRKHGVLRTLALLAILHAGSPAFARDTADADDERFVPAESLEGNYLAAVVAGSARDLSAASLYLREAIRNDPRNEELLERGFIAFLADGSMRDSFRAAEQLVRNDPTNGLAQLVLGVRAIGQKQYGTARRHFQRGGRGRAADLTATLLAAWAHQGSGQTKSALDTVERLRGEPSFDRFRDFHSGLILDVAGRRKEAARRLQAAYEAEKTNLRLVDLWARFQARQGDRKAALATLDEYERTVRPDHPIVKAERERLLADQPLPRGVANVQEGAAEVLYGLASAGIMQGDEATALLYLQLAVHLDPGHDLAVLTLGDILERAKQTADAVEVYRKMPATSALKPVADIQIGLGLESLGRSEEAVKHMEALIAARPDDIDAISALGNIYRSRKQFAEAAAAYDKAVAKLPSPPERSQWSLFYARGIAYERTKQWSKAEADLRKALELLPESLGRERALVLNYLGYSLVDQHMKLDEALGMLRRAVELRPRDGYITDSLGWAFYRLGRFDEAVVELERAVELRPADPVINDHLGDAYWRTGREREARFQWNHARDLGPEPEDKPKILRKIEKGLDDGPSANAAEPKKEGG